MRNKATYNNFPVIMYTSFTDKKECAKEATVYIDKFKDDIKTLISEGYSFLSLSDILLTKSTEKTVATKCICIVFFGGYRNHYELAFPIIRELNIHVDMFIATDLMGLFEYPGLSSFAPHYSWQEADEMKQSGLVNIYAMWHPFDNGKNVEFEVAHKIKQIKENVMGSNPQTAFCMNINENTEKKQDALEKAGVGLNLVYYWSFKSQTNEGQVPYIGINQESNVLDVIEHFRSKVNSQVLLAQDFEWIDNVRIDWKPKNNGIVLPINTKPRIKNLLRNAIPLSIIGAARKDREDLIVLNNYIEVVSRPWYHFFDYDNHMYLNWPELSCCRLTKEFIKFSKASVPDIIIWGLNTGFYADVWADEFYIPLKPGYRNRHLAHNVLIYGYDQSGNVFKALSYIQGEHYAQFDLKPEDLIRSCLSEYFCSVQLIKNNPECQVSYDIRILSQKLKRYVNSTYEYANNTKCVQYDQHQLVNYEACERFPQYIADVSESENKIYIVCFYSYVEHKRCMGWRLDYIAKKEGVETGFFSEYKEHSDMLSEKILKLGMKYNMTNNKSIVPRITDLMHELNEKELKAIQKIIDIIG